MFTYSFIKYLITKSIIEASKYELADFADELLPFCEKLQERENLKYALEFQLYINESIIKSLKSEKEQEQYKYICRNVSFSSQ